MEITERHLFGWKQEIELKERLESFLACPITKTATRYDSIDFTTNAGWRIELKARRAISEKGYVQREDSFDTWLMPASKAGEGIVIWFYWWEHSNRLWFCLYDADRFQDVNCCVPHFHRHKHFYVPRVFWEEVLEDEELCITEM